MGRIEKGFRSVDSTISKMTGAGTLEPTLATALKAAVGKLHDAIKVGKRNRIYKAVGEIARLIQRGNVGS